MKHRSSRPPAAATALMVALFAAFAPSGGALAAEPDPLCGQVLTESFTLAHDIDCTGHTGPALTLAASDITLDGAGFRLLAPDASAAVLVQPATAGVTVQNLDVSAWCAGTGIHADGVSSLTLTDITADGRAIGFDLRDITGLTLTRVSASSAADAALVLTDIALPLTLADVSLTNSATGLRVAGLAGPLTLDASALPNLSGNDVGIHLVRDVTALTLTALTIDAAITAIDAGDPSNASLTLDTLDLSNATGIGTAIALGGANHTVSNISLDRRTVGLHALNTAGLRVLGFTANALTDAALLLDTPIAPLELVDLALTHNARGLVFIGADLPLTIGPYDTADGSGAIRTLHDNDISIQLVASSNLAFEGFAADALVTAIDASSTLNTNLSFTNLDLTAHLRGGTGLALGGAGHTVSGLVLADLDVGLATVSTDALTLSSVEAARCTTAVSLANHTGPLAMTGLDLRDSGTALAINGLAGSAAVPRVIDAFDPDTGAGVVASFEGSGIGLSLSNVQHLTVRNVALPNRAFGISAANTTNANLIFSNVDVSGSSRGTGLALRGTGHTLTQVTADDRAYGVELSPAPGAVVTNLRARRCNLAGLHLTAWNSTDADPTLQNLDLRDNAIGIRFFNYHHTTTISGLDGNIDVAGSATGIFLNNSQSIRFEDLTLPTREIGFDFGVSATNITLARVDASGFGAGTGFRFNGSGHSASALVARDRALGVEFFASNTTTVSGLDARRATDAGLLFRSYTSISQSLPTLANIDVSDSATGVRVLQVSRPLVIDGAAGWNLDDVRTGFSLDTASATTLRNLTARIAEVGVLSNNSANLTLRDVNFTGRGAGVGVQLGTAVSSAITARAGANTTLERVTLDGFGTGVIAYNPSGLSLTELALRRNAVGLHIAGFGAVVATSVALTAPSFNGLIFEDNALGLHLDRIRRVFTVDGATGDFTFSRNDSDIRISGSTTTTVRNHTLPGRVFGVEAVADNTSLTLSTLDVSGPHEGTGIRVSGAGHALTSITAHRRGTGVHLQSVSSTSVSGLAADFSNQYALHVDTAAYPLSLTGLQLRDSRAGLRIASLTGTGSLTLDDAKVGSLAGNLHAIELSSASGVTVDDSLGLTGSGGTWTAPAGPEDALCGATLTASLTLTGDLSCPHHTGPVLTADADDITIDGAGFRIDAPHASTLIAASARSGITVRDIDLSGRYVGGVGVAIAGGADHTLDNVVASRRATGIAIEDAASVTLTDVVASDTTTAGLRLTRVAPPIALTSARLTNGAGVGLLLSDVHGASGAPVAFGTAGLADLSGNATSIRAQNVSHLSFGELALDGHAFGLEVSSASHLALTGLDVSGSRHVGAGLSLAGTAITVSDLDAHRRAFGVFAAATSGLTLADIRASGAASAGVRIQGFDPALQLSGLLVHDSRAGLSLATFEAPADPPVAFDGDIFVAAAGRARLAGNRIGLELDGVRDVTFNGLQSAAYDKGVDASASSNARLRFIGGDLSGPGSGTGLHLGGTAPEAIDLTASRRARGIHLATSGPANLARLTLSRASDAALYLDGVRSAATLSNLTLTDSVAGMHFQSTGTQSASPLVVAGVTDARPNGAIALLAGNDTDLRFQGSSHIHLVELRLSGRVHGALASTGSTNLRFVDIDADGPGAGAGLHLNGAGHQVENVRADLRASGLRLDAAPSASITNLRARRCQKGLELMSYGTPTVQPSFDGLDLRDNAQAIAFQDWQRLMTLGSASNLVVDGSDLGIIFLGTGRRVTLAGLVLNVNQTAIEMTRFSDGIVMEDVTAKGLGGGVGIVPLSFRHVLRRVEVSGFNTGIDQRSSQGNDQRYEDVTISGASTGFIVGGYGATNPITFDGVLLEGNRTGFVVLQTKLPTLLEGDHGVVIRDAETAMTMVESENVIAENLQLEAARTSLRVSSNSSGIVLGNIEATGFGRGVGVDIDGGSGHSIDGLVAPSRETGLRVRNTSGITVSNVSATNASFAGVDIGAPDTASAAPSLSGLDVSGSRTGLRLGRFDTPLLLDPAALAGIGGTRVGLQLRASSGPLTVRDLTIDATETAIRVDGTVANRHTYTSLDLSGQCRGTGLRGLGPDHRAEALTVRGRAVALDLGGVANFQVDGALLAANARAVAVSGVAPIVQTTVASDTNNTTTRLRLSSDANVYAGQRLMIGGNERVVATVANSIITFDSAISPTPTAGTQVRCLNVSAPRVRVQEADLCANGAAVEAGTHTVTATPNFWRDPTGPAAASNPDGRGDPALGTALTLSPWASVAHDLSAPWCNQPPAITLESERIVCEGDEVTLDASDVVDAEDHTLAWSWHQVGGPEVGLEGASTPTPSFTATPEASEDGEPQPAELVFEVRVTDAFVTRRASTTIFVYFQNLPPVPSAGEDFDVAEDSEVTLDATASVDPEGTDLTYTWTQISGIPVTLEGADTANPTFQAPDLDVGGESVSEYLVFEVTATDTVPEFFCGEPKSASATVTVEVRNQNTQPDVVVPDEQIACPGDIVLLDASDSTDRDGDPLTFAWSQSAGQAVTLQGADAATAAFVAPEPEGEPGPEPNPITLDFEVVVDDGFNTNSAATSVVVRRTNVPPSAVAEGGTSVDEGGAASFDATASQDPEATELSFSWRQVSGTVATIDAADTATPTVTLPLLDVGGGPFEETLVFEVAVTDEVPEERCGVPETTTATVEVVVRNVNTPPTAHAGDDAVALAGNTVTLDGTLSADPDNDTLGFAWEQVSGLPAALTGADTAQPTFVTPTRGEEDSEFLVFRVTVDDGFGGTDTDEVTIIIGRACQSAADCGDGNPCTVDICLELGYCTWAPEPPRTDCDDGWLCDGANTCVQCLEQADCIDPWTCTIDSCVDFACNYNAQPEGHPCEVGTCSGILAEPACIPDVATFVDILYPVRNGFVPTSDVEVSGTGEPASELTVTLSDRNDPRINYRLETTVAEDGTWAVVFPGIPDGGWSALVEAVDIFENEAEDGPIPFVVDSRAPKLTITAPVHGALLNSGTVTVRGQAEKNRPVRLTLDGVMVGDAMADGNGAFSFVLPGVLADGPHEVIGEMTDLAGNAATARTMFDIDTEAPWLRLERPGEDRIFTERDVEFGGFGEPKAKVVVVVIQTDVEPEAEFGRFGVAVGDNGQWSVTSDALPDGTFLAEATAADDAGNVSAAETVTFEVDSRAPTLVIDRPLKGALTNNRTPTVEGSTDARAAIRIAVLDGQGTEVTTSQPNVDGEGAFVWTIDPPLSDGVYRIRVTATGPNGFQTTGEVDITVDATAPALAITSPADGETVKGVWLTVSGTAETDSVVDLYLDGETIANLNIYQNTDWRVALERPVSPGPHNLSAIGRDAAGNSTTVTAAFEIESDGITGPGEIPDEPGTGGSGSEKSGCGGGDAGGVGLGLLLAGLLARRRR